jgi:DDE superfamily endonuclease
MVIHVRSITNEEGNKLRSIVRRSKDPIEIRRAQVVLASAQGFAPPKIGEIVLMTPGYVRTLLHSFNLHGFKMLQPDWKPGGNRKFTDEEKQELVSLATSRPSDLGLPFQQWSLRRLKSEAEKRRIVASISKEWLRVILDESEISFQSVKTWKESKDPEFEKKKQRIERLTRKQHNPPIVLSLDEMGPFSLIPHGGRGWFEQRKPSRIPANYRKLQGVRFEYICLNVYHQQLSITQYEHKGGEPWLEFLKKQRSHYPPDERVYMIQDGLRAHWTPDLRRWAHSTRTTLVRTATNASWMNPVECHTSDIQKLALSGTDYKSWDDLDRAFLKAVSYRNSERKARGKKFRDTQITKDGRRKHRRPLWKRH